MSTTYWAQQPPLECVSECSKKVTDYHRELSNSGRLDLLIQSYSYYNAILAGRQSASGVSGFSTISINHYRNLLTHLLTMTVNQRPAFEPRAVNTDHLSQLQCQFAKQLLDYYMRDKRLEVYLRDAVEYALLYGEAYLVTEWDSHAGDVWTVDPDTGDNQMTGDMVYSVLSPLDVVRDIFTPRAQDCTWYIVRRLKNKYDLAAKYASADPQLAEAIMGMELTQDSSGDFNFTQPLLKNATDLIYHYTLYHNRTPACPEGRVVEYLDEQVILFDGPLPYRTNPVNRLSPAEQIGTPFGYSVMFDLIPLQEALNGVYSTIKTNQETFGVQNVVIPRGSGISVNEIIGGLNMIEYDPGPNGGKIEALNLTKTAPEIFTFMGTLEKLMEVISGVNSVARGDPQSSLKSGAALALVQSQAIQFSFSLQYAYTKLLENTGQATINAIKAYADAPRIASIVGKNNQTELKEFTAKDLSQINRVLVDQGNPMTRTTAGKVELAQMLIQMKQVDTPEQLLQVIQTGNLESLTEGRTQELMGIKSENEFLSNGREVPVMITDMHVLHIKEHAAVMSDPSARLAEGEGALIAAATMKHIAEHLGFLQNPENAPLLQMLGQQPAPPQPGPQPGPQSALPQGAPTPANEMAAGMMPDMPQMPKDALTGQRFQPMPGPQ